MFSATIRSLRVRTRRTKCLALVALLCWVGPTAYAQQTIYVDDNAPNDPGPGDPSVSDPLEDGTPEHPFDAIQEGIDAAVDGDTILVADGTYTGEGNKNLDFYGKGITVQSENGPENCIIDCEGGWENQHRGFYFHNAETALSVVHGFTIRNGFAGPNVPGGPVGGGICCEGCAPTIANCVITENRSLWLGGGGIYCANSGPTIRDCTITLNGREGGELTYYGGGICCEYASNPVIVNCNIAGNSASEYGGGIYCADGGNLTITGCTISDNTAGNGYEELWHGGSGGGVYCWQSRATIIDSLITTNVVGLDSGTGHAGVCCRESSSVTIIDCVIAGNRAILTNTSAVASWWGGSVTIIRCTITGNGEANVCNGSAVDISCAPGTNQTITDCTITDNYGSGITCRGEGDATIKNCTIARNTAGGGGGVAFLQANAVMIGCTVTGNQSRSGGGVSCLFQGTSPCIVNCKIVGNTATYHGGAILCCLEASPFLTSCLIADNLADSGGGVSSVCSSPTISNCTFVGNTASYGRALACVAEYKGDSSTVSVDNCIMWNGGDEVYNNDGSTITIEYSNVTGGWPGAGNIDADPSFVDADGPDDDPNTWEDNDYHLLGSSPCIDTGDPDFVPAPGETDLDGQMRLWDADNDGIARVDMGSDEFGSFVYGDLNCDGLLNAFDIDPFVLAITDTGEYETTYPNCNRELADINGDGAGNAFDIDPFVALLVGG